MCAVRSWAPIAHAANVLNAIVVSHSSGKVHSDYVFFQTREKANKTCLGLKMMQVIGSIVADGRSWGQGISDSSSFVQQVPRSLHAAVHVDPSSSRMSEGKERMIPTIDH